LASRPRLAGREDYITADQAISMSLGGRFRRHQLKCDSDVGVRLQKARVVANVFVSESVHDSIRAVLVVRPHIQRVPRLMHI